ncbi:AAA family ATPase [Oricola indica]|uniref:AAA family ATPase n=1 Tax=Oricola indica TaxID=2872591 RepID=UPI003CCBC025
MSFEELLSWSNQEGRPDWQKDALRRIATTGELTDDDLTALSKIIEKDVGLYDDKVPLVIPLGVEHLSDAATDAPRTILGSIGPVRRIDRLASDQPPIRFAKRGVTLVHGANASGKSGYCRIAKQLCRSLSPQELKGNVYEEAPPDPPEVDLVFGVEGGEPERREATWKRGDPPPQELARVSVFDTESARLYVDKDRKVEFLPYELDLINKLALAAKAIDGDFEARENILETAIRTPLPAGYNEDTAVSRALAKLSSETARADLPEEAALRALAEWDNEKEADLQRISNSIRDDPLVQLRAHRTAKQELENMKTELAGHLAWLGDGGVTKLVETHTELVTKAEAARAAALGLGDGMPIPEIGTAAWRQMLIYAREFAGEAFPDHEDPKLVTGDTCVLCQQRLDGEAAARMTEFDRYISGRAASDSKDAREAYDKLVGSINSLRIKTARQAGELLAAYAGMSDAREALSGEIAEAFTALGARLAAIAAMIERGSFDGINRLVNLPADLLDKIESDVTNLQVKIGALEGAEADGERMNTLLSEAAELEDAKRLSQEIEIVAERQKKLVERLMIKDARKKCASGPIARQLTVRRRALLTDSLKTQLSDELKALRLSHIPIDLSDRSAGGDSVIEIGLTAQQRVRNNSDVLSEGEQRALALSCFLAELNEVGAEHGIIVDDPVSSLDHSRMEAVAKRLVAEAGAGRQVVIFTHNIVFHYMVENEARRVGVPCHAEWMMSIGGTKFGIIDESGKPSHSKKTKQRIGELTEAKNRLFRDGYDPASPEYRDQVTAIYTLMRETWERLVEEILFNGAIQRFRPEIMTQSLKHACYDPTEDYPAIFEGMKRCSHYSGHDQAADLPSELPSQEAIEADLQALQDFHKKVSDRKSGLESPTRNSC